MPLSRFIACALLLALAPVSVRAEDVPIKSQALLVLRTLAFDRNLKARSGKSVRICVVYKPHHPGSEKARVEMVASLGDLARTTVVAGLPVQVAAIPWDGTPAFRKRFAAGHYSAVFVAPGLNAELDSVLKLTRAESALTFTSSEELVQKGVSVGLVTRNARPLLLVHLRSSRKEGANLDSNLLRISEVIR
jgi:hypothetical protein